MKDNQNKNDNKKKNSIDINYIKKIFNEITQLIDTFFCVSIKMMVKFIILLICIFILISIFLGFFTTLRKTWFKVEEIRNLDEL
jgi:uncharacterized membrane protein (DUF106 family)